MSETLRRNQSPVGEIQDALDFGQLDAEALMAVLAIVRASKERVLNARKDQFNSRVESTEGVSIHA